jgi:hypothetical protein
MTDYVEVYTASDISFAYLVKAQLEDAGIPVRIANENVAAAFCIDGMVPRVLVPASHEKQAREVISEMQRAAPNDAQPDDLDDEED